MTGAPDPSGPQRHSPEDTQGVAESFWNSPGSGERCLPAAPPQEGAGPLSGGGAPASTAEHAVNRRMVAWCSSKREGGRRVATVQTDFGSPGPGLAFSLPRLPDRPQPLYSAREAEKADPLQPLFLALLASPAWLRGDNQTGIPPPRGPSLTLQVFNSLWRLQGLQLQLESTCPVASSSGHRGCCRHRLTHTSKNQDPQPGGREAGRTLARTPAPSIQALGTRRGRLPPGTSQLWLSLEATLRPSH